MFNGQDDAALGAARQRWQDYNNAEKPLKYYQQTDTREGRLAYTARTADHIFVG